MNARCLDGKQFPRLAAAAFAWLLATGTGAAERLVRFDFEPRHLPPRQEAAGGPSLTFDVEWCKEPPTVDGSDSDAAWKGAEVLDELGIPTPPTRARFLYDDTALYLFVQCESEPGKLPQGERRERDHDLRKDESIHFCVRPDLRKDVEYLFRLSVADSVFDARNGDESWNADWAHAVRSGKDGWSAEVALPYAILGLDRPPGRLGFNIGRRSPDIMIRSWFNPLHTSAAASALVLKGAVAEAEDTAPRAPRGDGPPRAAVRGRSLTLRLDRDDARPQDRWVDALLYLKPRVPLKNTRLSAKVFDLGSEQPLDTASIVPEHDYGMVSIDLRTPGITRAEVAIDYFEGAEWTGLARFFLSARSAPPALTQGQRIAVKMDVPEGSEPPASWPITFGVPFPAGTLWEASKLRLVDQTGREIPSQKEVTGRWAREGAIQWVRFDALATPGAECFVDAAPAVAEPPKAVTVTLRGEKVALDTGVARYLISKGPSPIEEVWLGGRRVAASGGTRGLYVVDQTGRTASAASEGEKLEIEARGPVAACVRLEGFYKTKPGEPLARHLTRVEAFAGQPFAKVTHTLVITRDTNEIWFKEVGWELAVAPGAAARGVFNIARAEPGKTVAHPLADGTKVTMLQDEHTRFGAGKNHFTAQAGDQTIAEGEECGDWGLLVGNDAGFLVSCREAARQHPKEFALSADRVVLKLFSNRAGEELDFRSPALARKWNLKGEIAEKVSSIRTNAAGWAKTHELCFAALPAPGAQGATARPAPLHTTPVYASVDPRWIRRSEAMGPLNPRDVERFPEVERVIGNLFEALRPRGHENGHYGFMDYYAGPTYGGVGLCGAGRYRLTYGLRSSIWLVYARSGDRVVREFAEGTNKAYLDNYLIHWDAPGKVRGLFTGTGGKPLSQLPFYWGQGSTPNISSSTNLDQFLWLYHLTGYRRAKDAIESAAEGLKRDWHAKKQNWRVLMVFRMLTQCYGFTWDPELRALAEGTFDAFTDPDGEILVTKNRPYGSSTYKTAVDVRALIEGWRLFGLPKYRRTALRVSRFWWERVLGKLPVSYMNPLGFVGSFLYDEFQEPAVAAGLDFGLRRAGTHRSPVGASAFASIFESLPYAMSVVARQERGPAVPCISYRDYGYPSSVLVSKTRNGIIDLTVLTAGRQLGRLFELRGVNLGTPWGQDLHTVSQHSGGIGSARIPKDAPAGTYEIVPGGHGEHFVLVDTRTPTVLHAPKYWTLPDLAPVQPIYFKLTPECHNARIFFEGKAKLFDPKGEPFGNPEGIFGWVDLPQDRAGLWRFEPIENRLVRGKNFPPFYAIGSPDFYFDPPVEWDREPPERVAPPAAEDVLFVTGAIEGENNRALRLSGKKTFRFGAGPPHGSGDGGRFFPYRQGTIEFFFKPEWSTFDLGPGSAVQPFVRVDTDRGPWSLTYRLDPKGTTVNLGPRGPSHSLYGFMCLNNPRRSRLRVWRTETLFERNEWVHLAWAWGPRVTRGPHNEKITLMAMGVYVNGRGKRWTIFRSAADALPQGNPKAMVLGPLRGAVDELRVSDVQRFSENFSPPPRHREFRTDANTRALFHFDGSLEGVAPGEGVTTQGEVK